MTTPAADCGVTAGCGACPLGRAGVCGDPGTPAPGSSYFRMFDAPAHDPDPPAIDWAPIVDAYLIVALAGVDTPDLDPAEPRPVDAGCCGGGCGG